MRRIELMRRLEDGPVALAQVRRSRLPVDFCRVDLVDGSTLRLRLLWPPAGTAVAVSRIVWRDDLGWLVKVIDGRGEALTWYAWSLRVV